MTVAVHNYSFKYDRRGKPVFAPSKVGRRIGSEIKDAVEATFAFSPIFFHFRAGGHVAAIHHHRPSRFFARIDIARFFYSISRRRVQSALDRIGVGNAAFYAKWSTVANPFEAPRYALPYGFVQSPILASLVLASSTVGEHLGMLPPEVTVSVYVDDISLSSDNLGVLEAAYDATISVLEADGFQVSADKLRPPAAAIDVFNCDLAHGLSKVRDDRIDQFMSNAPSHEAEAAFAAYCASVEVGNG
ncbi:reverse transcriptase domain-containing protein [Sphingomonas sp. TX0543]|uniref:reverse transcriptase domain-containing protein n=1 Tax=Sphingomonas sp. TX0543 TaxID=3399682 RepID=UPI003AFA619E